MMKRYFQLVSAGMMGVLATGFVNAQQPAQPTPVQKIQQSIGNTSPISQAPWFSNPAIRQQLNLNDTQFNQLNKVHTDAWLQYQQGLKNLGDTLTPEQRMQRMTELQQNYYKSFSKPVNEVFTDPQMRARYDQLNLQYRGYDAYQDPTIQAKLSLTAEQRQKLSQYHEEWRKSMDDLRRDYQTDPQGVNRRFEELRKREAERSNSVLTQQQRQIWRQIAGDPYNFQLSVYFPSNTTPPSK